MKVYVVRRVETNEGLRVCMSLDTAEIEVKGFYSFLDIKCYISIETH